MRKNSGQEKKFKYDPIKSIAAEKERKRAITPATPTSPKIILQNESMQTPVRDNAREDKSLKSQTANRLNELIDKFSNNSKNPYCGGRKSSFVTEYANNKSVSAEVNTTVDKASSVISNSRHYRQSVISKKDTKTLNASKI